MISSRAKKLLLPVTASVYSSLAHAADPGTTAVETAASVQDPLAMTSLWQLTLGMVAVLGLIMGIAWLLKRSGRFQIAAGGGLRVLGGLSMGTRERVVLLQVGETQLLLGVAPGRVQTLHVLEQPLDSSKQVTGPGFSEQLSRILKKEQRSTS
jgi:flagellar protein FliO/FliZ